MAAPSYTVPAEPVAPGSRVPPSQMRIIESMPVKSLVTFPQSGISPDFVSPTVRGMPGPATTRSAEFYFIDFGETWLHCVNPAANRLAWQNWETWCNSPNPVITKSGREPWTTEEGLSPWWCRAGIQGYSITPVTAWRAGIRQSASKMNRNRNATMTPDRYFARQALTLLLMTATVSVSGQDIDDESGRQGRGLGSG